MKFLYFYIFCSFGLKHGPRTISHLNFVSVSNRVLVVAFTATRRRDINVKTRANEIVEARYHEQGSV